MNQIETDFFFQEYQRNEIEETDVLSLLQTLLQYGMLAIHSQKKEESLPLQEKKWIEFHVAAVKNQLMFYLRTSCPEKIKVRKKDFRGLLKKYNGTMNVSQEEGKLEIILGLTNDIKIKI